MRPRPRTRSCSRRSPTAPCTSGFRSSRSRPRKSGTGVRDAACRGLARRRARRNGRRLARPRARKDPYNLHALNWKQYLAEQHGSEREQATARAAVRPRARQAAKKPGKSGLAPVRAGAAALPSRLRRQERHHDGTRPQPVPRHDDEPERAPGRDRERAGSRAAARRARAGSATSRTTGTIRPAGGGSRQVRP